MARKTPYGEGTIVNTFANKVMMDINVLALGVMVGLDKSALVPLLSQRSTVGLGLRKWTSLRNCHNHRASQLASLRVMYSTSQEELEMVFF